MARRYVRELAEGESVDQVFLASEKQMRPNRAGNLYLQVRLSDKTGSLTGMLWNAKQEDYDRFENGDYVRVQGKSQLYNSGLQIIARSIQCANSPEIDPSDFQTLTPQSVEQYATQLAEALRAMRNFSLRNLAECFLMDEPLMERLRRAPAGIKNHHAYHGGLLQHITAMVELAKRVAPLYDCLDEDLLVCGAFLHDLGKVDELTYENELGYSDAGQLLGHMTLAISMLEEKIKESEKLSGEPFPVELALRLKHMILSHHGQLEYGSPKLPMTHEAVALHLLDNLDARLHNFQQLIDEDVNADSSWTVFHKGLGRKIYKGPVE